MDKFARTVGQAKMGTATYTQTLQRLGISSKQLAGSDLDQAFRLIRQAGGIGA